jgi:glutamate synthase domain-containing protein 3
VLDLENEFPDLYNTGLVVIERLDHQGENVLRQLIVRHLEETGSARAREILGDWEKFSSSFWKVLPRPPSPKPSEVKPSASSEAVISEKVIATQP